MAVSAKLRAGGRWLTDAALIGVTGALLAPLVTAAAILLAVQSFVMMRTNKNLERAFAAMLPCFEGNETEQNWTQRQQSIDELRKLTKSDTPSEFPVVYLAGIKQLLDGIVKAATSLRSTLSANGCKLVKEIAIAIGSSLDPAMLEKLLPPMISICGHTKPLDRKNGDEAVTAVVSNVPITYRILHHISESASDNNFSTRMCTAGWLKVIIKKSGRHCEQHSGQHNGLDLIDRCIRTGLQDAKPEVREPMRDTYWTFARIWPDRAESIMSSLDARAQKILDQHPNKPHDIVQPEIKVATSHTTSRGTVAGPAKLSIQDIKRAAARARKAATETSTTENDDNFQSNSAFGGVATQSSAKEPAISAPTNKPSVKEMKLASSRTRKAVPEHDDDLQASLIAAIESFAAPAIAPVTVLKTGQAPSTAMQGGPRSTFTVTVGPAEKPPKEAPATVPPAPKPAHAPPTATQGGSHSTFTVTAGPTRNPTSQPSSTAPKRALLSSAPVRRPRRPLNSTTMRPTSALSELPASLTVDYIATEQPPNDLVATPATVVVDHIATEQPSYDLITTPATVAAETNAAEPLPQESETVPAPITLAPTIPVVSGQENDNDTLSHKHTWNNKELAERRRSISPRSKDPEEARKLLARGIDRINSRSIDDHGYRKLQGLINYHDQIFQDEQKYDDMLLALLNALETPNTEKRVPLGRRFDNKFQILVTIRLMFVHNRKYFAAYFPRAMSALVTARRNFESRNHIVSGLEETAQDITAVCSPPDVIDAVMDVLETEERDEAGSRAIAMGLHILSGLSARMRALQAPLEPQQEKRMAKFALNCLRERTSIVRRAVIEYCLELKRIITPEARYFRLVTGDVEDLKNLITYYAANNIN